AHRTLRSTQEFAHRLVLLEAVKEVVVGCSSKSAPRAQGTQNQKPHEEVLHSTVRDRHLRYLIIVSITCVREHVQATRDSPAQVNAWCFIACRQYVRRSAGEVSASPEPHDCCKNGAAHLQGQIQRTKCQEPSCNPVCGSEGLGLCEHASKDDGARNGRQTDDGGESCIHALAPTVLLGQQLLAGRQVDSQLFRLARKVRD